MPIGGATLFLATARDDDLPPRRSSALQSPAEVEDHARVSEMLTASAAGDRNAAARLMPLVYESLRALAQQQFQREAPGHTLQPTAIVHEAFLRLLGTAKIDWKSKNHFYAVAASTIRRVLVDHARAKATAKRARTREDISLPDVGNSTHDPIDVLALDDALSELARSKPRHAQVVELRYFSGLTADETAGVLGVSKDTVKSDWRFARLWLNRELMRGEDAGA